MDQPVISTEAPKYLTREFLETTLVQNKTRIDELEKHISVVTQRSYGVAAEHNRMVEAMQEWTFEAIEAGTLNESEGQEIADICGFELTKEFEVEATVVYTITVNARNEEEAQNLIHDIDFDTVDYNSDSIQYLSSSVERVDIQQGATNKPEHVLKLLFIFIHAVA